jgi:large subunit ribosomal protein L1
MKQGKRFRAIAEKLDPSKQYSIEEAVAFVKEHSKVKFDETIECAIRLGIDPKKSDQMIRTSVMLPHGTGKKVRVLVLAKGDKEQEATAAGADFVGSAEYIEKIQGGWLDCDAIIATPDMMRELGKLGKILGPRGLMPNPKSGTVTMDVAAMVKSLKAGRVECRNDKAGNIQVVAGKASFSAAGLVENIQTIMHALSAVRPASVKGQFIKAMSLSSTMGAGLRIDLQTVGVK